MEEIFTVYILYSEIVKKYYTGFTSLLLEERLSYHNYKNSGFTGKADDWIVVYNEEFSSKKEAMTREKQIKKRGASRILDS